MTSTQHASTTDTDVAGQQANPADAILRRLATRAMGLTGADIERVVREARLKARRGKRLISYEDIEEGIRGNRLPVPYDLRWRSAFHEAGHAVVHHALDLGPVRGLNIDTGQGGGYNLVGFHLRGTGARDWYENMLTMLMAGRAAEKLVLKRISSGSGGSDDSDLARATRVAFDMERTLGLGTEHPLLYRPHRDPATVLDRDPELAARIHGMLEVALDRAAVILRRRRPTFYALAKALFEAQAMDETAVLQILRDGDPPP